MNFKLMKPIAVFSFVVCLILPNFVHSQNGLSATDATTADVPSTQTVTARTASENTINTEVTSSKSTAESAITSQNPSSATTSEPKATTVKSEATTIPEPETTSTAGPDPTTTVEPETTSTAGPNPTTTVQPETPSTAGPDPTTTVEPETTSTAGPDPTTTVEPETTSTAGPNPTTTVEPESPSTAGPDSTTTVEPETTSTAGPDPTTTVEPETTSTAGPDPTTTVEPEVTTTVEPSTTNPPQSESTTVDAKTTTQTQETTVTTESNEKIEEIGEEIAEKLFRNVARLQKQSDQIHLSDYDHLVAVRLGLVTAKVHYYLKNCILSGTSRVKSQSIHPTSPPGSPIRQFRGFAQIDKLTLRCGGYTTFGIISRSFKLDGEIKNVVMRVSLNNYRKSGNVVVDSLTLQRIKEIKLDLKIDWGDISVTKGKFLDHFRDDLHATIATLVSDVIAKNARQVAASMKVQ